MDKTVNQSVTFNTYMQVRNGLIEIVEIVHIIVLYSIFNGTNNSLYDALQAVFSGIIFMLCFTTRLSHQHYALLITFISFLLLSVTAVATIAVLIKK